MPAPRVLMMSVLLLAGLTGSASGLDHAAWDQLLKKYVTAEARVDYRGLKEKDLPKLDAYLSTLAAPWPADMTADARKAALINAYNALTVRWIIEHYPVASIQATRDPFTAARHRLNGEVLSLDQTEGRLRDMGDPRIHAAVICAARSCPPLRGEAYEAELVDEQLDDNTRRWLANGALNEFDPAAKRARVSPIFQWYAGDFGSEADLRNFLRRYAPGGRGEFLSDQSARIEYQGYDWGLNEATDAAAPYPRWRLYLDFVRNHRFFNIGVILTLGALVGAGVYRRLGRKRRDGMG